MRHKELAPVAAGAALFLALLLLLPGGARQKAPYSTVLYSRSGELLGAAAAEDGQWRFPPGGEVPERYARALTAFEDRRFYGHPGFDTRALARALLANIRAGRIVSGGSTISMQVARMARGNRPRTLPEKILEILYALRLEAFHNKREILAFYAELAPYGGNVVGLEAASFRYFGRPPRDLTWAEAAVLAVLPNSPALVHPGSKRGVLGERRDALLRKLASEGAMTPQDLSAALAEPLPRQPEPLPRLAPHLLDRAAREGLAGKRVYSTLDAGLQARVRDIVERHASRLGLRGIRNAAVIVANLERGEVLAYVGNTGNPDLSWDEGGAYWVDCAAAPRSTGSILKPFLYASMLDAGDLTPRSLVADLPTSFGAFSPENSTHSYSGAVPAERALAHSLNVPFVRLLRSFGVDAFLNVLKKSGFTDLSRSAEEYGLTLILGGAEATLWDAAAAYGGLARAARGFSGDDSAPKLSYVQHRVDTRTGREGYSRPALSPPDSPDSALSPDSAMGRVPVSTGAAYLTLKALLEVSRPAEEAAWKDYAEGRRIAWKTGTSQGFRDAWAIGVTSEHVVAVWVGNATGEGRPELKGSEAAAPLLFDVFELLPRDSWFDPPPGALRFETLCADSGFLAGPSCANTLRVEVPAAAPPCELCPYCRLVHFTEDGRYQASAESLPLNKIATEKRFVLPPALEWYYRAGHPAYRPLPPFLPGSRDTSENPVTIIVPEEGTRLYIPIELDGEPGRAVFRAVHRDTRAHLFWHMDGEYLGQTVGPEHSLEIRPGAGAHVLTVMDEAGRTSVRRFEVLSEKGTQ